MPGMLRFVILRHETPADYPRPAHFDLMLEQENVLWTWALEKLPAPGESVIAERLPDHRLMYLDYEGVIAGGRGNVSRVEVGECEWIEQSPGELKVRLRGSTIDGVLRLTLRPEGPLQWDLWLSEK